MSALYNALALLSALFLLLALPATAQDLVNPTTAAASATPPAEASGYVHIGCWNETTGYEEGSNGRAIGNGKESANDTMTVTDCLAYCARGASGYIMQYAGLEYGRECYCGATLSELSTQVNESECKYACNGDENEVCGGQLALTLYNLSDSGREAQEDGELEGGAGGREVVGGAVLAFGMLAGAILL